jgi:hypothetical protein
MTRDMIFLTGPGVTTLGSRCLGAVEIEWETERSAA